MLSFIGIKKGYNGAHNLHNVWAVVKFTLQVGSWFNGIKDISLLVTSIHMTQLLEGHQGSC